MAYRFDIDEGVRDGIRRCAVEQLDVAVRQLSERLDGDPVEAVHSARKAIKKERSLLRLARGAMPAGQRRRENRRLRDAARAVSQARDAEVMLDTFDQLAERYAGQLPGHAFDAIRERLVVGRDRERAALTGTPLAAHAARELRAVRTRVPDWRLSADGWSSIEPGLRRSYADGRQAFARSRSDRSFEGLHAWRRRVKDLWYEERLLATVAGPTVTGQVKDVHRLGDLLGDDHDLGVLRAALTGGAAPVPVDLDAVIELIDHRRGELQAEALRLGARVYAEKPGAFVRRMRTYWAAGRAQARAGRDERPAELAEAVRAPHPG